MILPATLFLSIVLLAAEGAKIPDIHVHVYLGKHKGGDSGSDYTLPAGEDYRHDGGTGGICENVNCKSKNRATIDIECCAGIGDDYSDDEHGNDYSDDGGQKEAAAGKDYSEGKVDESAGDDAEVDEAAEDEAAGDEAAEDEAAGDEAAGDDAKGEEDAGDDAEGEEDAGDDAEGEEDAGDDTEGFDAGDDAEGDEAEGAVLHKEAKEKMCENIDCENAPNEFITTHCCSK